jgi:hypothetical protein
MKLSYHEDDPSVNGSTAKYWYAATEAGGYDAAGPTVEAALANLVAELERALGESE